MPIGKDSVRDDLHAGRPEEDQPLRRRWVALAILSSTVFITSLDNSVLNVALPTLAGALGASSMQLQWIVDAYTLVLACTVLTAGSLVDRHGRRRGYFIGLIIFGAASAGAAFAASQMLVMMRAAMGLGAAFLGPATLSIVTTMFVKPKERNIAFAIWGGMAGVGLTLGPVLGGVLVTLFDWRSIFLLNVPVAVLVIPLALFFVPESASHAPRGLDPVGALLSTLALGCTLWATIASSASAFLSLRVMGVLVVGLVSLVLLVLWERRAKAPMLPAELFRDNRFNAGIAAVSLMMFGSSGALFILSQQLQTVLGYGALETGLRVLPVGLLMAIAAAGSPRVLEVLGARFTLVIGLVGLGVGLSALAIGSEYMGYAALLPGLVLMAVGAGLVMPAAENSIMAGLPVDLRGVGSAINNAFFLMGTALGVAVLGSIWASGYRLALVSSDSFTIAEPVRSEILESPKAAFDLAAGDPVLAEMVKAAFIDGVQPAFFVAAVSAAIAALVIWLKFPVPTNKTKASSGVSSDAS